MGPLVKTLLWANIQKQSRISFWAKRFLKSQTAESFSTSTKFLSFQRATMFLQLLGSTKVTLRWLKSCREELREIPQRWVGSLSRFFWKRGTIKDLWSWTHQCVQCVCICLSVCIQQEPYTTVSFLTPLCRSWMWGVAPKWECFSKQPACSDQTNLSKKITD